MLLKEKRVREIGLEPKNPAEDSESRGESFTLRPRRSLNTVSTAFMTRSAERMYLRTHTLL